MNFLPWFRFGAGDDSKAFVHRHCDIVSRVIEGKNQFHFVELRIANEAQSAVGQSKIKGLCRITGPIVQPFKISSIPGISHNSSHNTDYSKSLDGNFIAFANEAGSGVSTP